MLQKKWRMTNQRKVILDELRKSNEHLSVDELYIRVRERIPSISISTVYRNLEELSKHGLIRKLESRSTQKRFDANTQPHFHILCVKCGRIDDVPFSVVPKINEVIKNFEKQIEKITGYDVVGYHFEFLGICPKCKREEEKQHDQKTKR